MVKLPRVLLELPPTPPEGLTCICIVGKGSSRLNAPSDAWLWGVNPDPAYEYARKVDVAITADPAYIRKGIWQAYLAENPDTPLIVAPDIEGPWYRMEYTGPRLSRNPFIPGVGTARWSAVTALLCALTIWDGPVVLAGIDLDVPTYRQQARFWRSLSGYLPKRVSRVEMDNPGALGNLPVIERVAA
jgi:hypothetical protein